MFTSFFITKTSLNFLFSLFFRFQYCYQLETIHFQQRSADFFYFILICGLLLNVIENYSYPFKRSALNFVRPSIFTLKWLECGKIWVWPLFICGLKRIETLRLLSSSVSVSLQCIYPPSWLPSILSLTGMLSVPFVELLWDIFGLFWVKFTVCEILAFIASLKHRNSCKLIIFHLFTFIFL